MAHRPHPKYASNDARQGPWTTCDVCGFIWSMARMAYQFDYRGGSSPMNTGFLKCPKCMDGLAYQRMLLVLPPDPPPQMVARPENYAVDETNWLTTQDGDIFETVAGDEEYITSIPNPAQDANTTNIVNLTARLQVASLPSAAYLDLFLGDPTDGGVSVLHQITGSATRTNVFDQLSANTLFMTNPLPIAIAASCAGNVNADRLAVYSAASGGSLIASAAVGATYPQLTEGVTVQIPALGLYIILD